MLWTWLPSALQGRQLGSSTVITKLKVNSKSSAFQVSTTTELPSVLVYFVYVPIFQERTMCTGVMLATKALEEESSGTLQNNFKQSGSGIQRSPSAMLQWKAGDGNLGSHADYSWYTWEISLEDKKK